MLDIFQKSAMMKIFITPQQQEKNSQNSNSDDTGPGNLTP